jgi:tetratricopeptide (TPR) repeat protein
MDWHDTERLLRRTVADFPDSYHAHLMLGAYAFEHQRLQEGERELKQAFTLFPYDALAPFWLAEQYRKAGLCPQAIKYYQVAQTIVDDMGNVGHAKCLVNEGGYDEARAQIRTALQRGGDARHLHELLLWVRAEAEADSGKTLSTSRMDPVGKLRYSVQKTGLPSTSVTEKRH